MSDALKTSERLTPQRLEELLTKYREAFGRALMSNKTEDILATAEIHTQIKLAVFP